MLSSYAINDKCQAIYRGEVSLQELIDIVLDFSPEPVQMAAIQQIKTMGESARQPAVIQDLTKALILASDTIRMNAAAALNAMGKQVCSHPEVRASLTKALSHIDWATDSGQRAGKMLAVALANPEFFEQLAKQLCDPLTKERITAANIIYGMRTEAADPKIIAKFPKALEDKSTIVREKIAGAMRNIGIEACTEQTIPAIINALQDSVITVRREILHAIEAMYPASADQRIITAVSVLLTEEPDRSIYCEAARILELLTQPLKDEEHQEQSLLYKR